jgi:hypothetical protein
MSEHIKRSDALNEVKTVLQGGYQYDAVTAINAIPAADVVERPKLVLALFQDEKDNDLGLVFVCQECGKRIYGNDHKFCSGCGNLLTYDDEDPKLEPYNPDHIPDATKKVDQFREPTQMMEEPKPLTCAGCEQEGAFDRLGYNPEPCWHCKRVNKEDHFELKGAHMPEYITKEQAISAAKGAVSTEEVIDKINTIPATDVVENAKRTTFEPDAARDLKDFVQACEIDDSIMGGFEADRMKTYLYALIDESTIGFDWSGERGETPEQRGDRHLRHIMEMQSKNRKDGETT